MTGTASKLVRTFPELAGLPEPQRASFVSKAKGRWTGVWVGLVTGLMVLLPMVYAGGFFAFAGVANALGLTGLAWWIGVTAAPLIPGALLCLMVRRLWWHHAIERHLAAARCDCGSSLLSESLSSPVVRCSGCGQPASVSELGLLPVRYIGGDVPAHRRGFRVPWAKAYRAFPDLDPFDDEDCRRFVKYAQREHRASQFFVTLGSIALFLVLAALCWAGFIALVDLLSDDPGRLGLQYFGLAIFTTVLIPAIACFLIRDKWLIWAVRQQIYNTRCACGYSLLGLGATSGVVVCPECGSPTILEHRGLTPEHILARESPDDGEVHGDQQVAHPDP